MVNIFQSIFRALFSHNIPNMFLIIKNVLMCLYIVENVLSPLHYDRAIHAAQHERAGRVRNVNATGSAAGLPSPKTASGTGHLTRSRPQDSCGS